MSAKTTDRKSYGQFCPMGRALDVVGDRWTMLIVRELLGGAARFNELQEGLPTIAKNLLSTRLRRLEEDGVVRRLSSHGATLYALTERGAALRSMLEELAFWGAKQEPVAPPKHPRSVRAIAMALQAILARASRDADEPSYVVELDVDGEPIQLVLSERPTATATPGTDLDARVEVTAQSVADYLAGRPIRPESFALAAGSEEARHAVLRALRVLS